MMSYPQWSNIELLFESKVIFFIIMPLKRIVTSIRCGALHCYAEL